MQKILATAVFAATCMGCSALSTYTEEGGSHRSRYFPNPKPINSQTKDDSPGAGSSDATAKENPPAAKDPSDGGDEAMVRFETTVDSVVTCFYEGRVLASGNVCKPSPSGYMKEVTVSWPEVAGARSYFVYWSTSDLNCNSKNANASNSKHTTTLSTKQVIGKSERLAVCVAAEFPEVQGKKPTDVEASNNPVVAQ